MSKSIRLNSGLTHSNRLRRGKTKKTSIGKSKNSRRTHKQFTRNKHRRGRR